MARDLDIQVEAFRTRPLTTGVNTEGYRKILGLHVSSAEDGAGWLGFLRDLTARGLSGVALVTSDAHRGLPRRSARPCRARPGSGAALTTPRI